MHKKLATNVRISKYDKLTLFEREQCKSTATVLINTAANFLRVLTLMKSNVQKQQPRNWKINKLKRR